MVDPHQLLADAQGGDPDWGAIYRLVREPMYRTVWRVVRRDRSYCGQCDDDIVMKAFEELMRKELAAVTSLVAMAMRIARCRALDVVAGTSREVPYACFDDDGVTARRRLFRVEPDERVAEELMRSEELFKRVVSCLPQLAEHQRIAFVETVMNRRPVQDVAEKDLGGVSTQAVYKLRQKATRNIRRCLGSIDGADEEPEEGTWD